MRKRPSRVCNKSCSPGVRRFQLVPCVPARQTPKGSCLLVFSAGLCWTVAGCTLPFTTEAGVAGTSLISPLEILQISDTDTASGKNAKKKRKKESATFSTRQLLSGLGPRTRTSAITHDFFTLFSPRGSPQDWQPVRKNLAGVDKKDKPDKPGRVVCVTWRAGLTWCPRVGAGKNSGPQSRSGGWAPDWGSRICGCVLVLLLLLSCSALGWAGLGLARLVGLGDSRGGTQAGYFWGEIRQE